MKSERRDGVGALQKKGSVDSRLTQPGLETPGLLAEREAYQKQEASKSYLAQGVSALTAFIHGSPAQQTKLEELAGRANVFRMAGATDAANKLLAEIDLETEKSRKARARDEEVTAYGTNFLKTGALFYPGVTGRIAAGVIGAADGAKHGDSYLSQGVDGLLGGSKLVVQKLAIENIGKLEINVASKAFLTGMAFRGSETLFSKKAWLDKETGAVDPMAAVGRTLLAAGDPNAAFHDLVVFGGAHFAMGHIKTYGFDLLRNRVSATVISGGMFGLSSGTFNELKRSREQLVPFEYHRALVQGALDSVAALPGGLRSQVLYRREAAASAAQAQQPAPEASSLEATQTHLSRQSTALAHDVQRFAQSVDSPHPQIQLPRPFETLPPSFPIATPAPAANPNRASVVASLLTGLPRSTPFGELRRQFLVVAGQEHLNAFTQGGKMQALLQVREVHPDGTGERRSLLVQHMESSTRPSPTVGKVDLIATCHPELFTGTGLQGRHVLPEASGPIVLSEHGRLITFAPQLKPGVVGVIPTLAELSPGLAGGITRSIVLNRPVADLLREVPRDRRYWDLHDLNDFATAARIVRTPGKRIVGGGVDSMAIQLVTGDVLKMTEKRFDPSWGTRTYTDPVTGNPRRFDARILSDPRVVEVNGKQITMYLQEHLQMPISLAHLRFLVDRIDGHSKYQFWDIDFTSPHGQSQAGYSKLPGGRRGLVVADYDAVRLPQDVPKVPSGPQTFLITPWD